MENEKKMFETLQSDSINELATALSKAQGEIGNAIKDAENPYFKSKYATLAGVREAAKDSLAKNGLAVVQQPTMSGDRLYLATTLTHSSGQWMRSFLPVKPVKDDPQGLGSAITYMRRYALAAITGVAPDDDDDGNAASAKQAPKPVDEKELDMILDKISDAGNIKELQDIRSLASSAKHRMNEKQQLRVADAIKARAVDFPATNGNGAAHA